MTMRTLFILLIMAASQYAHAFHIHLPPGTELKPYLEKIHADGLIEPGEMTSNTSPYALGCTRINPRESKYCGFDATIEASPELDTCEEISIDVYIEQETCPGACDATIAVNASGGHPPYTYAFEGDPCYGFYTIFVTDAEGCTDSATVFILPLPDFVISDIQVLDATDGAHNGYIEVDVEGGSPPYFYSLDGIAFQFSPVFTNLPPGSYCITIIDDNGCITKTDTFSIENSTSTITFTSRLSIYPNPADTYLFVESDTPVSLELLDVNGNLLKQTPYLEEHNLGVAEFPRGIYILRLTDGKGYTFQKITLH